MGLSMCFYGVHTSSHLSKPFHIEKGDVVLVREAKLLGKILIREHLVAKLFCLIPT